MTLERKFIVIKIGMYDTFEIYETFSNLINIYEINIKLNINI